MPTQQDDRPCRSRKQSRCIRTQLAALAYVIDRREHHGERLFFSPLGRAQPGHCSLLTGIDQQMETADSLDRNDLPLFQNRRASKQGLVVARQNDTLWIPEREPRTAVGTGIGLCMEASVRRVLVLRAAGAAHRESTH